LLKISAQRIFIRAQTFSVSFGVNSRTAVEFCPLSPAVEAEYAESIDERNRGSELSNE
jgi:hypothetical protein